MTVSLDEATARRLQAVAKQLAVPTSHVVRDAIREYAERRDRVSEREQRRLLQLFDELIPRIPDRPVREVDAEIDAVRAARRGVRLHAWGDGEA